MANKIEKRFKCSICTSSFAKESYLKKHIQRVHEKKKSHQCNICKYAASQKGHLKSHIQTVHGNKRPYNCVICLKAYGHQQSLDRPLPLKKGFCFILI